MNRDANQKEAEQVGSHFDLFAPCLAGDGPRRKMLAVLREGFVVRAYGADRAEQDLFGRESRFVIQRKAFAPSQNSE